MAKRFIDGGLWSSDLFLGMTAEEKLLWLYLETNCSAIGIVKESKKLMEFKLGFPVLDDCLSKSVFGLQKLENGDFWIEGFVARQYGTLNPVCKPHYSYIRDLKELDLLDRVSVVYPKTNASPKEKEKEKEKEKDKDKDKEKEKEKEKDIRSRLEILWNASPPTARRRSSKDDVLRAYKSIKNPRPTIDQIVDSMESWKTLPDWTKEDGQFVPGLHRWLKRRPWEVEISKGFDWKSYMDGANSAIDNAYNELENGR